MKKYKKHLTYSLFILLNLILLSNTKLFAQEISDCPEQDETYTGQLHFHLTECKKNITVTGGDYSSTIGTEVTGIIQTNGVIRILPGTKYSAKIIAPKHSHTQNQTNARHQSGTKVGGGNGFINNRTKTQVHKKNTLLLYPNPATNIISLSNFKDNILSYQLINEKGMLIKEYVFNKVAKNHEVNIETLKTGFYVVNITLTTGETITKALIKQ